MPVATPRSVYKNRKRLDAQQVKDAAVGRWNEILVTVAGLPAESLDGRKHPCPKCGGTDRFRAWKPDAGGVRCNQCFDDQNGDGLAAVQWALGVNFRVALRLIADYLGVEGIMGGGGGSVANGKSSTATANGRKAKSANASARDRTSGDRKKPQKPPDANLKFVPWNDRLAAWWTAKKPPIRPDALKLKPIGARMAVYRGIWKVIALPIWRQSPGEGEACGWALFEINGGKLPVYEKGKISRWEKTKTTYGSAKGIMGVMK